MRAHGIDISKWQYPFTLSATPPRPVDFIIQRTSYGRMRDEQYNELKAEVLKVPIRGAYHYASSAVPWREQADMFLILSEHVDFLAWDFEKGYNQNSASYVYGAVSALDYLAAQSGKPVLLYCSPDTWATWLKPVQADLLRFDLWIAHYWTIRGGPESKPNYWTCNGAGNLRRDWRFWQYDDKGGGNKGKLYGASSYGLDLDVFNGTVEELRAWVCPGSAPRICPTCGREWPED